jgi:hypothetical protein
VLATIIIGVALLAGLVVVELRVPNPLVNLRLFREHRLFTAATALYGLGSVSYLGVLYLAALFFQDALHLSAPESGLAVFPSVFIPAQAVSMATTSKAQTGQASPIFNAGKQLGGAVGVALLSSVLAAVSPGAGVHLTAFHAGFAVAVASVAVALCIRDAATMVRAGRQAGRGRLSAAKRAMAGSTIIRNATRSASGASDSVRIGASE